MSNPDVLLLDELSLGLAPSSSRASTNFCRESSAKGVAPFSSNRMWRAQSASANKLICMLEGTHNLEGSPPRLFARQISAAYFGTSDGVDQRIVQGVLIGGLYALFATGLSLIFGVMRLVNIAHGDLIVAAAYLSFVVTQATGINPLFKSGSSSYQ